MLERFVARLVRGWSMAVSALSVVRRQPSLLALSALPFLALVALLGLIFWSPIWLSILSILTRTPSDWQITVGLAMLVGCYLLIWIVMVFFNTALVFTLLRYFETGRVSVSEGLAVAASRWRQVLGWAVVGATVGVALSALTATLKDRLGFLGEIAGWLFEATWGIATYFVAPVLAVEGLGPIAAVRRSTAIMRQTWGETLGGEFGLGLLGLALALPVVGLGFLLVPTGLAPNPALAWAFLVGALIYVALLSLLMSTLGSILRAALYAFATTGHAPDGFDPDAMAGAFQPRR